MPLMTRLSIGIFVFILAPLGLFYGTLISLEGVMRLAGGSQRFTSAMKDFASCLFNTELDDLNAIIIFYSYSNKQDDSKCIFRKLDRVLVHERWTEMLLNCSAEFFSLSSLIILPW
ncbi:hypothetical protein DVH24_005565 [Malus domestica]|uniref:Uncharacterized protein n=1 Tax=Malus domestica TaxID=3750 RepID=A0A498IMV4_MALDO|nr:hypothetical protein DVH24_005565 [Malus domestica]